MRKNDKVFVTGHEAMVGSAIVRRLRDDGFTRVIARTYAELDLTEQKYVSDFFMTERPDYVFLTGAKVGGILANSKYPAEFIYQNLQSQTNVIHAAWKSGVKKLLFLGSSCIYPKNSPQPMKEEYLLSGKLEPTSEPYAVAKIAGIRMCQSYNQQFGTNFISVVPADVYGPDDDYDPETGHVFASLIRKIYEAKVGHEHEIVVWGTGAPRREALHLDDLADACLFLMNNYDESEMINAGSGEDFSIGELILLISDAAGFKGEIVFDKSKPDGSLRKLLDISKIKRLGWSPKISLKEGIKHTYRWYENQVVANKI